MSFFIHCKVFMLEEVSVLCMPPTSHTRDGIIDRVRPKPNSSAELFGSAIVRLRFRGTELSILKVRLRLRGTELFEKKFLLNRTVRPNI